MDQGMMPMTVISTILTVIVGLLMLKASILLLKKRRDGLLWSNHYAWTSLGVKVINLVLIFIYVIPAMKESGVSQPDYRTLKKSFLSCMDMVFLSNHDD